MNRTYISSVALLVLSTVAQANQASQGQAAEGQASDASVRSSTIVSGPVRTRAADAALLSGGEVVRAANYMPGGSDPVAGVVTPDSYPFLLGSQYAPVNVLFDLVGSLEAPSNQPVDMPFVGAPASPSAIK